ncbi:MAG: carboxypeptidase-like regulatory domain-containing protein, partial [Planctomycetota bacterium]
TGPDGRFRLFCGRSNDPLRLHLTHDDYVNRYFKAGKVKGGELDVGDIALELGASLSGFIRDAAGHGISGAAVRAWPADKRPDHDAVVVFPLSGGKFNDHASSGPDGFYRITGIAEGKVTVSASHSEYISNSCSDIEASKSREQTQVNLTLQAGYTIAGHVVDEKQKPLAGARVIADTSVHINLDFDDVNTMLPALSSRSPSTTTNDEGAFVLTGLREGVHTIRAMASSYLPRKVENVKIATHDVLIVMQKGGWVAGRVISGKAGEGIEDFELEVKNDQWDRKGIRIHKGDDALERKPELGEARGSFFVEGLAEGEFSLALQSPGYGDEMKTDLSAEPGEGQILDIELWQESLVSGYLHSPEDLPIESGTVVLSRRKPEDQALGNSMNRRVMIAREGNAVSYDTGEDAALKKVKTDSTGYFVIKGVVPGDYELTASHAEYTDSMPIDLSITQRGETVSDLVVKLGVSATITGTVYNVLGQEKTGAKVKAKRRNGQDFFGHTVTADQEGKYSFSGLEPGEYLVNLVEAARMQSLGGFATITIGSEDEELPAGTYCVAVAEGEVSTLDLYELQKGTVSGRVTEVSKAVPDFTVKIFEAGAFKLMPLQTVLTDEHGEYVFENLMPGEYTVRLDLKGLSQGVEETVTLEEGGKATKDFALPTGRVSGKLTNLTTGKPVEGVRVSLESYDDKAEEEAPGGQQRQPRAMVANVMAFATSTDDGDGGGGMQTITMSNLGGGPRPVVSDEKGYFEINHVANGKYKLIAEGGGFSKRERAPVEVKEGKERKGQDIELSQGFNVSGTILDSETNDPLSFMAFSWGKLGSEDKIDGEPERDFIQQGGRFALKDLEPGKYRVEVDSNEYKGSRDFTVVDKDLDNLQVPVFKK